MSSVIRSLLFTLFILSTGFLCAQVIVPDSQSGNLGESHGNNFVRGRQNTVHLVYTNRIGNVIYQRGKANASGTFAFASSPGTYPGNYDYHVDLGQNQSPCVAEDEKGNLGIAYISTYDASGYGDLWYKYRNTNNNPLTGHPVQGKEKWDWELIAENVRRPALAMRKSVAHLTWEDRDGRILYGAYAADWPANQINDQPEIVFENPCLNTYYTKPSITVFRNPCRKDTVRIGAMLVSDESMVMSLACSWGATAVGPEVREKSHQSPAWTQVYDDVRVGTAWNQNHDATSISISANYETGATYLAYSDRIDQVSRTKLAVIDPQPTIQSSTYLSTQALPIHVIAYRYGGYGEFRVAWQGINGSDSHYRTGKWLPQQTVVTWLEPNAVVIGNSFDYREPQAIFWRFCRNQQANLHWVSTQNLSGSQNIAHDANLDQNCSPTGFTRVSPCDTEEVYRVFVQKVGKHSNIDMSELGAVKEIGEDYALVTNGHHEYRFSWERGRLEGNWEAGIRLRGQDLPEVEQGREAPTIEMVMQAR